jgi:4-alpha-glucanotransferase
MNASEALGEHAGIVASFVDARGERQTTSEKARTALLCAMGIDVQEVKGGLMPTTATWRLELEDGGTRHGSVRDSGVSAGPRFIRIEESLPAGYHTLILDHDDSRCSLIVTPGKCWLPPEVETGRKFWGVAIQLYLLRSEHNWGIGDFSDLGRLVETVAAHGGDVVGLNPLHAMFTDDAGQASPYSPASRLLLNVLNIDVALVTRSLKDDTAGSLIDSPAFQQTLARCREEALLDYPAVAALKMQVLRQLFDQIDRSGKAWLEFSAFRATAGAAFDRGCLFLALRSHFAADSPGTADWHRWPEEYRRADSSASRQFAEEHTSDVSFQAWLQFLADTQLRACADAASDMAIGLYRDLAVGANPAGAETWANPTAVVEAAQVGAPPDIYNPKGQDWGLPPFNPQALREEGYRSFIDLLRANMRHAGGLRIDHVMALQQLYWIPRGHDASDGAYVRYPLEDLVGILALESHRHECLVVGEDLGTVPDGFRERMERSNILSYRVLFFEKGQKEFIAPEEYPTLALAVAGSHDLPTLRAWWHGADLSLKEKLELYPTQELLAQARQERNTDREALVKLMQARGVAGEGEVETEVFVRAAHALLASARSIITMLQIDDLTGEVDPVNVPTTSDEHPNWRRRLSVSLEQINNDPRFNEAVSAMASERQRAPPGSVNES